MTNQPDPRVCFTRHFWCTLLIVAVAFGVMLVVKHLIT